MFSPRPLRLCERFCLFPSERRLKCELLFGPQNNDLSDPMLPMPTNNNEAVRPRVSRRDMLVGAAGTAAAFAGWHGESPAKAAAPENDATWKVEKDRIHSSI